MAMSSTNIGFLVFYTIFNNFAALLASYLLSTVSRIQILEVSFIREIRIMVVSHIKLSSSSVEEISNQQIDILNAVDDAFGGVIVEMKDPMNSNVFDTLLRVSISCWREQGKKGIWLKLPIELANLVEAAVKQGFWYHHAEPTYLMLAYWIPETAHTLPANASHTVGIGAFIMNKKREILVVQENNGRFKGSGLWKLPTGTVDVGEDIVEAAIREVKEETGIKVEFMELLAVRQSHNVSFGKSDLFFVFMLRPLSFDIQKQDSEIAAATWMPFEEYAAQSYMQKNEHFNYIAKICAAKIDNDYTGFCALPATAVSSRRRKSCLYFNNHGGVVVPNTI
ncbi:putative Mutt domain protein [Heracleum sosnowskyi]|uniref:Mutt domain protein n=1 Tax=Heracleum sosnowskyi TaxID=360622 RepID=A0AAD8MTT9_9APIA|nr:putative Mutt domain protein [Heracleum sosnowskyi]